VRRSTHLRDSFTYSERAETIDVMFSSAEQRMTWEKTFAETKKLLGKCRSSARQRRTSFAF
jgi:hypothetical protein